MTQETVDYKLRIIVGSRVGGLHTGETYTEIHLPVAGEYLNVLEKSGLTSSDTKTKTLVVLEETSLKSLTLYAALCGMASRTLDCEVQGVLCRFVSITQSTDPATPTPPSFLPEDVLVLSTDPGSDIDFGQMLEPENSSRIYNAKKVVLTGKFAENPDIPAGEFLALVQTLMLVASVRQKPAAARYPALYISPTYGDLDRIAQGDTSCLLDLESIRKEGGKLRRSSRTDDRTESMPPLDLTARQRTLLQAADINVEETLTRLHSHKNQDTGLWRCSRPQNHRNGDANPSSQVGGNMVRCYKCDMEPLDSLRLVVETLNVSPDDAALWLLSAEQILPQP